MNNLTLSNVRDNNTNIVLKLILENPGISRLELSNLSGLSGGTITSIVNDLLNDKKIEESKKRKSTGGRPKVGLSVITKDFYNVIFEIKQRSIIFKMFKNDNLMQERLIKMHYLNGNTIVDTIVIILDSLEHDIDHVGVLLEENIDDNEVKYLFSTSISQDTIPLEMALKMNVKHNLTIDRSVKYLMSEEVTNYNLSRIKLFAYVSIDDFLTTQVFTESDLLSFSNKRNSIFKLKDIFEINNELDNWESLLHILKMNPNQINKKSHYKKFVDLVTKAIKSMLVFYPLDAVFLIGQSHKFPTLDQDIEKQLNNDDAALRMIRTVLPNSVDIAKNLNEIILKQQMIGGK